MTRARRPLRYRGLRVSSRTQHVLERFWVVVAFAALALLGTLGMIGEAQSDGRSVSTPAAIALGVVWATWIAVAIRRIARRGVSDTRREASRPPDN